ncbi:hypothetical protein [Marinobacterium aestuariivivens]|uniref:Uncharacterized protein n=1 Tax=Marinobacterium aestuariivivens TaxID=1698799 RepID=A0ABW2A4K6_9GAMM
MTDSPSAAPPATRLARRRTSSLAGWLLLLAAVGSCTAALTGWLPPAVPGALAWGAGLLLFRRLGRLQRVQVALMLGVGGSGLLVAAHQGQGWDYAIRGIAGSQGLIAMLVAVGFLRLIAAPGSGRQEELPRGRRALWQTLFGTHFSAPPSISRP